MKLEVVVLPVSDVDRAKRFYGDLGWRLDIDYASGDDYRVIQFTPPGSGCSIIFGTNVTTAAPGSAKGLHLIVSDIEATRRELLRRGVAISELFHDAGGMFHHAASKDLLSGPNPERKSYASYASFSDPDGNGWVFQEITARLTGHIAPGDTSFTPELTNVVRGASASKPGIETHRRLGPPEPSAIGSTAAQNRRRNLCPMKSITIVAAWSALPPLTFVASQFAFGDTAEAQPSKAQAGESGSGQAGHAHVIRAAEADRRRRAQYRLCRSRSRGRPGGDPAARMAV